MISNLEIDYLDELINEFPPANRLSALDAYQLLKTRYDDLEKNIPAYISYLNNPQQNIIGNKLHTLLPDDDHYPLIFYSFCILFYEFLFENILSNSAKFRSSSDSLNGMIGFGGPHRNKLGSSKFSGCSPTQIEVELEKVFLLLRKTSTQPLKDGLEFYRRFVRIHPFYDANGRIARLLFSIFLWSHGLYINWRAIETGGNKTKFLKKLNSCHRSEFQPVYSEYFNHLFNFINKFVTPISAFEL